MPRQDVQMLVCVCIHTPWTELLLFCRKLGGVDQGDPHLRGLASSGSCPHLGTVNREEGSDEHPCLDGTFQDRETRSVGSA